MKRTVEYDPSVIHSVASLASYWQVEPSVIYKLVRSGKLKAFKVGREIRVTDRALREFEEGVYA